VNSCSKNRNGHNCYADRTIARNREGPFVVSLLRDMPTPKHLRARIVSRQDLAPDLWKIRLHPEQPIVFQPGQYATLGVETQGSIAERPYSICSSPEEPDIEFFFELVAEGDLTPQLHPLGPGDEVLIRPACKGLFTFDRKSGRTRHLMVATVTGVAPFLSMIRTMVRRPEAGHHLYLLVGASRSWEFGYVEELQGLARANEWLDFIPTVSRCWEDPEWRGERGRVDDILRKYADRFELSPADTSAYLCGHPAMIINARRILERRGFLKNSIKEENYFVLKPQERRAA